MKSIEPWIKSFIQDRNLVVMRTKKGQALNVSYTQEGLKWTTDLDGNLLYYKDCRLKHKEVIPGVWRPYIDGSGERNPNIIIEAFIPRDHQNPYHQSAEYKACNKALRLLYTNNEM